MSLSSTDLLNSGLRLLLLKRKFEASQEEDAPSKTKKPRFDEKEKDPQLHPILKLNNDLVVLRYLIKSHESRLCDLARVFGNKTHSTINQEEIEQLMAETAKALLIAERQVPLLEVEKSLWKMLDEKATELSQENQLFLQNLQKEAKEYKPSDDETAAKVKKAQTEQADYW